MIHKLDKKTVLIIGAAITALLLWYLHKKKQAEENQETFYPTAPTTYEGSQEAAGNFGNYGGGGGGGGTLTGGGLPAGEVPGVTTAPPPLQEVKYITPQEAAEKKAAREKWEKEHGLVPISQEGKEAGLGGLYYTHPPKEPGPRPQPAPYPYHPPAKEPRPNFH